jgi:hypothetical protein
MQHPHRVAGPVLALIATLPCAAPAQPAATEIQQLRQAIAELRADHAARLQALEQRLQAAEAAATAGPSAAAVAQTPAQAATPPTPSPQPVGAAPAGANAFNPAVSLILSGLYARTSRDPAGYAIAGVGLPADAEVGPGSRGFSLAESELGLSASIDPWWRGSANIALHPDDTVSVEEAYVQTTALGHGLSVKAGRFFSGAGYLNSQHAHTWDFVDNPLAYQALLGTQYADDGVQLNWLAPTDLYLALGAELGRGRGFPGGDNGRNGAGMAALTAHAGGDLGDSHSWRAGVSVLTAKADGQELVGQNGAGEAVGAFFSGRTRVWIADAVWKWAPGGNASQTSFKLQGEYLRSTRRGALAADADGTDSTSWRAVQSGWYLQGIYQFMPRWRLGLRTERLDPGAADGEAAAAPWAATDGFRPRREALMLDYSASEFSRVRLQLAQDRSRPGSADRQVFLQYQMSLGAHGAHSF